jgi:hypothetical protein
MNSYEEKKRFIQEQIQSDDEELLHIVLIELIKRKVQKTLKDR